MDSIGTLADRVFSPPPLASNTCLAAFAPFRFRITSR